MDLSLLIIWTTCKAKQQDKFISFYADSFFFILFNLKNKKKHNEDSLSEYTRRSSSSFLSPSSLLFDFFHFQVLISHLSFLSLPLKVSFMFLTFLLNYAINFSLVKKFHSGFCLTASISLFRKLFFVFLVFYSFHNLRFLSENCIFVLLLFFFFFFNNILVFFYNIYMQDY